MQTLHRHTRVLAPLHTRAASFYTLTPPRRPRRHRAVPGPRPTVLAPVCLPVPVRAEVHVGSTREPRVWHLHQRHCIVVQLVHFGQRVKVFRRRSVESLVQLNQQVGVVVGKPRQLGGFDGAGRVVRRRGVRLKVVDRGPVYVLCWSGLQNATTSSEESGRQPK